MKDEGNHIRKLPLQFLDEAVALTRDVFMEFVAPGYGDDGIRVFLDFISPASLEERILSSELCLTGCFCNGRVVGVAAMEAVGHISLLFVEKTYQRKGIARSLVETACGLLASPSISCVTVNSSPYAVEVYKRLGFEATEEEQCLDGIRFTPMELRLCFANVSRPAMKTDGK